MRNKSFYLVACGIMMMLLNSCINGTPGTSNNNSVAKNDNTLKEPMADNSKSSDVESSESSISPVSNNPTVNVFLETSGSMNGYVNGGTSIFQQVIKEYLSGLNNAQFASDVNYYYVNNKIVPRGNDLDAYITKLTPTSFSSSGNTGTTDIGGIFKEIIGQMDNNTVSIFISDCIISPGTGVDTQAYLRGQMTDVRDAVKGYITQYGDFACLVYQFDSGFKGAYYDFENRKHPNVNMQRPFYIWVFGHTYNIALMKLNYVPDKDFKVSPFRNQWMIFNTPLEALQDNSKYGLLLANTSKIGKYTRVDGNTIRGIQKADEQYYRFSFGANMALAQALMGDEYVEDTDNYIHVINKAVRENFYGHIEKDYSQKSPYTEIYYVNSESPFQKGTFNLSFIPQVPKWAVECSDYDDRSFNGINDNKTYGLEYIFHGIFNGFNNGGKDNILAEFNFEIR